MTSNELIKKYEEELLFCDDRIKFNLEHRDYKLVKDWNERKKVVREFLTDLKKLLV